MRFAPIEPAWLHDRRYFFDAKCGNVARMRTVAPQKRRHFIDAFIGTLRREHDGDEQCISIRKIERYRWIGIIGVKDIANFSDD